MARDLPSGIFRTKTGFRVFVRLSRDHLATETFGPDAPLATMKQWREDQRVDFRRRRDSVVDPKPEAQGFEKDAETYLKAVASMTSFADRKRDINWWVTIFKETPREQINSHEIAAALASARSTQGKPLSASTLNHRRSALAHLWRTLDGKSARNPVRDVQKRREPDAEPRGLPYDIIQQIFDAMADSATKARLMVMAWTGIPPAQIKTITAGDIDLKAMTVYVRGRAKGHGTRGRLVPLMPEGVKAFKVFIRNDAFGTFSRSSMWKSFRLACTKVEAESQKTKHPISLAGVRVYDIRHSYGTQVYAASGDIRATQILMGHSKPEMTHRYTLGAVDEQVGKALSAFTLRMKNTNKYKSR
jgi:integrase